MTWVNAERYFYTLNDNKFNENTVGLGQELQVFTGRIDREGKMFDSFNNVGSTSWKHGPT